MPPGMGASWVTSCTWMALWRPVEQKTIESPRFIAKAGGAQSKCGSVWKLFTSWTMQPGREA